MASEKTKKYAVRGVLVAAGLLVLIQLVPYGRSHTNPPVVAEPEWDSTHTRELFFRACKDCHSNETVWPWYSHVAPVSWLVQSDVEEGRGELNVSNWGDQKQHGRHAADEVREGEMPLWFYLPMHAEARLNAKDKQDLIDGLEATFGRRVINGPTDSTAAPAGDEDHDGDHDDD